MISVILNNALYFSFLLILVSSIIGVFLRMRARDRCLTDFKEYKITLELTDGELVWGILHVFGSGIELEYQEEHKDRDGHFENSYILYN